MSSVRLFVLIALLCVAATAAAERLPVDTEFGPGSATRDTDSGLDWLDLTVTANLSWNAMQPLLQPGAAYAGWRYATEAEFIALAQHVGVPLNANLHPSWGGPILELLLLLGINQEYVRSNGERFRASFGIFDIERDGARQFGGLSVTVLEDAFTGASLFGRNGTILDHVARTTTGHWLVREAVVANEPGSWGRVKTLWR